MMREAICIFYMVLTAIQSSKALPPVSSSHEVNSGGILMFLEESLPSVSTLADSPLASASASQIETTQQDRTDRYNTSSTTSNLQENMAVVTKIVTENSTAKHSNNTEDETGSTFQNMTAHNNDTFVTLDIYTSNGVISDNEDTEVNTASTEKGYEKNLVTPATFDTIAADLIGDETEDDKAFEAMNISDWIFEQSNDTVTTLPWVAQQLRKCQSKNCESYSILQEIETDFSTVKYGSVETTEYVSGGFDEMKETDKYAHQELPYDQQVLHYTLTLEPVTLLQVEGVAFRDTVFDTLRSQACASGIASPNRWNAPLSNACSEKLTQLYPMRLKANSILPRIQHEFEKATSSSFAHLLERAITEVHFMQPGSHQSLQTAPLDLGRSLLHVSGGPVFVLVCPANLLEGVHAHHSRETNLKWAVHRIASMSALSAFGVGCRRAVLGKPGSALVVPPGSAVAWKPSKQAMVLDHLLLDQTGLNSFTNRCRLLRLLPGPSVPLYTWLGGFVEEQLQYWDRPMFNSVNETTELYSFSSWKEQRRWSSGLRDATVRISSPVHVSHIGRTNVTLTWLLPSVASGKHWSAKLPDLEVCVKGEDLLIRCLKLNPKSVHTQVPDQDNPGLPTVSAVVSTLSPDTNYMFKINPCYQSCKFFSTAGGCTSWNRLGSAWMANFVRTLPKTVPGKPPMPPKVETIADDNSARLEWQRPLDDGGDPITSYTVWKEGATHTHEVAGVLVDHVSDCNPCSVTVMNLIPGRQVKFRVSASNAVGQGTSGELSEPSGFVSVEGTNRIMVGGKGSIYSHTAEIARTISQSNLHGRHLTTCHTQMEKHCFVTINDTDHSVVLHSLDGTEDERIESWAAHYSPKKFVLHAPIRLAEPEDACSSLGANSLVGYVVLVSRGNCPLVSKVQHVAQAGGLGVVITDTPGGSCSDGFGHKCSNGDFKEFGTGFASHDPHHLWEPLGIPSVLVPHTYAGILRQHGCELARSEQDSEFGGAPE